MPLGRHHGRQTVADLRCFGEHAGQPLVHVLVDFFIGFTGQYPKHQRCSAAHERCSAAHAHLHAMFCDDESLLVDLHQLGTIEQHLRVLLRRECDRLAGDQEIALRRDFGVRRILVVTRKREIRGGEPGLFRIQFARHRAGGAARGE